MLYSKNPTPTGAAKATGTASNEPQTPAQTKHRGHGRMRQDRGLGRKSHVMMKGGTMIDTEPDTVKDVG